MSVQSAAGEVVEARIGKFAIGAPTSIQWIGGPEHGGAAQPVSMKGKG
jgi:hypothetical protein